MIRKLVSLAAVLVLAACTSTSSTTSSTSVRPSSPAKITIISPTNGETIHGTSVDVVVAISGGEIVKTTSTTISPTQGHVHLYLQNQLIYMAYSLSQAVAVTPGQTYTLHAEFVASDHLPFSPRDVTSTVVFTVAP